MVLSSVPAMVDRSYKDSGISFILIGGIAPLMIHSIGIGAG